MMNLHKKCNSISNSSTSNILNITSNAGLNSKKTSNHSLIEILSHEKP